MRTGYLLARLSVVELFAATCQAQPPRGGNRGRGRFTRGSLFRLLEMPQVSKELGLRNTQLEMLNDLRADLGEQQRAVFSGSRPVDIPADPGRVDPEQAVRDRYDAIQADILKIHRQGEKLIAVILDPKQTERLNQLRLQEEGSRALIREEIREKLELTDEQFAKLQALGQVSRDPSASRRRLQQKLDQDMQAVLSEAQQVKFKELKGDPFQFPLSVPPDLRGLQDPRSGNRPRRPSN